MIILRKSLTSVVLVLLVQLGYSTNIYAGNANCAGLLSLEWDDALWSATETCENQAEGRGRLALRSSRERGLSAIIWIVPASAENGRRLKNSIDYLQRMADMIGRRNKAPRIKNTTRLGRFEWTNLKSTNPSGKISELYIAFTKAQDGRAVYVLLSYEPHRSENPDAVTADLLQRYFTSIIHKIVWNEAVTVTESQ